MLQNSKKAGTHYTHIVRNCATPWKNHGHHTNHHENDAPTTKKIGEPLGKCMKTTKKPGKRRNLEQFIFPGKEDTQAKTQRERY